MIKFLDLHSQYLSIKDDIDQAIADVIASSAFIGGPFVANFERSFADWVGVKNCVGVANGTDAIEIAIEALQLPPGSEIIVPGNTFIATSEAVTRGGHKVVFADVDEDYYNLTVETVQAKLTSDTRAIIAVHLYGHPCEMAQLMAFARTHDLRVIEDCAQAHGAEVDGHRVGTMGDFATFSFYPGKNLGAYGDAGAITTQDDALAALARKIANHGRAAKYEHDFEGRNSRLDGLQAAVLNTKLSHVDDWTTRRIAVADRYLDGLAGLDGLVLPLRKNWARQVYHLFVVRTARRDELAKFLADQGIQTGIHYPVALPKLRAYAHMGLADADMFVNRSDSTLLSLPIGEHLEPADVDQVIAAVRQFFGSSQ